MKFLNKLRVPALANDPGSGDEGEIWFNTTEGQLRYRTPTSMIEAQLGSRFNDWTTGRWYHTQTGVSTTNTGTIAGRAFCMPFVIPKKATITGIAYEITTAFTTAGNVRTGIYWDTGALTPDGLVLDAGVVAATVGVKTIAMTQAVNAGVYWVVITLQGGSGGTPAFRSVAGYHDFIGDTAATPNFNTSYNCYYKDNVTGAYTTPMNGITGVGQGPRVALKFA